MSSTELKCWSEDVIGHVIQYQYSQGLRTPQTPAVFKVQRVGPYTGKRETPQSRIATYLTNTFGRAGRRWCRWWPDGSTRRRQSSRDFAADHSGMYHSNPATSIPDETPEVPPTLCQPTYNTCSLLSFNCVKLTREAGHWQAVQLASSEAEGL